MNELDKQDASASDPSLTCTTRRYQLFECIGAGTTTTVHRALEHRVDGSARIVAMKRLLPRLADDPGFLSGFVRESRRAADLDHPAIARILTLGRGGTGTFVSMEYIDGHDLGAVLDLARRVAGPPPIGVVAALLCELCEALDFAHGRGLVHAGLTPANLIVTREGHLKVIDFGVARATSSDPKTQRSLIASKLAYRAPELLGGDPADVRSDLFSIGVIAHELLTGHPLFAAANDTQTLRRIQRVVVAPPSIDNPCCPAALDAIVMRALARDPAKRWQSAAELGAALAEVRADHRPHADADAIAEWLRLAHRVAPPRAQAIIEATGAPGDEVDDAADTLVFHASEARSEGSASVAPNPGVELAAAPPTVPVEPGRAGNPVSSATARWWPSLAVGAVVAAAVLLLDSVG